MREKEKLIAISERKDFIRLYQKIGWADFDKFQAGKGGLLCVVAGTMSTIKLAMAGTQEWWHLFLPSLVTDLLRQ